MRVVYRKPITTKIREAYEEASKQLRVIDCIFLTSEEMDEFKEINHLRWMPDIKTYFGIRIVEEKNEE